MTEVKAMRESGIAWTETHQDKEKMERICKRERTHLRRHEHTCKEVWQEVWQKETEKICH